MDTEKEIDILYSDLNDEQIKKQKKDNKNNSFLKRSFALKTEKEFNPFQIPPDLDLAKLHGQAKRISLPILEENSENNTNRCKIIVCPCCGLPIDNTQLKLNCSIKDICFLGPTFPLFLHFVRYVIMYFGIVFTVKGIFGIFSNLHSNDCYSIKLKCDIRWFTLISLVNKTYHKELRDIENLLNILTVFFAYLLFEFFYYKQKKIIRHCNASLITPSDYCLHLSNLPKGITKEQIKNYIENKANYFVNVCVVNKSYEIFSYVKLLRCKMILLAQKKENLNTFNQEFFLKEHELEKKIELLDEQIKSYENTTISQKKFTGNAFVIFETPAQSKLVLDKLKMNIIKIAFVYFLKIFKFKKAKNYLFFNNIVFVKRASGPTDILWENLGVPMKIILKKRFLTLFITFFILFICFTLVLVLRLVATELSKEWHLALRTFIQIGATFLIATINVILNYFIRKYTSHELLASFSNFDQSVVRKKILAQFLNTSLIIYLVSLYTGNLNWKFGLVYITIYIILCISFIAIIINIFDPNYIRKIVNRRKKENISTLTQHEAHVLFENPTMNMPEAYTTIVTITLFTTFYCALCPILCFFGFIIMCIFYWKFKILILRRFSLPHYINQTVSFTVLKVARCIPILLALSNWLFDLLIFEERKYYCFYSFCLAVFLYIIPTNFFWKKKVDDFKKKLNKNYYEVRLNFLTDYARCNPITSFQAMEEWAKLIEDYEINKKKAVTGITKSFFEAMSGINLENYRKSKELVGFKSLYLSADYSNVNSALLSRKNTAKSSLYVDSKKYTKRKTAMESYSCFHFGLKNYNVLFTGGPNKKKEKIFALMHFYNENENTAVGSFFRNIYNQPNQTYLWILMKNLEDQEFLQAEDHKAMILTFFNAISKNIY